ncbi:MAG: asparaginase [Nitriliruptorales bacterium]|nr:asparaginase [Nitriliruptorales bacterium]
MSAPEGAAEMVRVVRNGITESVHTGHVVVCEAGGQVVASLGDPERLTFVRSAAKPFQALAVLEVLDGARTALDSDSLAIACASHEGNGEQQIQAARLLAEAGLDESALQCPPALPRDLQTACEQRWPDPLAHNCSGKHASFLLATVTMGADHATYLDAAHPFQRLLAERLAAACSTQLHGPGVDGCGAPAWLLPLRALAVGFARLSAGHEPRLRRIRGAMQTYPELIGAPGAYDTELMRADGRVVAKRGAEAVFAAGTTAGSRPLGIAVKITDGGHRADGPVAAAVLEALGCTVPDEVRHPVVLGGGVSQGVVEVDTAVANLVAG